MVPDRLAPLLDETRAIAERFEAAGKKLYLVGGAVRDAILGRERPEWDFTTDARPEETEAIVGGWADALWLQGKRFGTVGARTAW